MSKKQQLEYRTRRRMLVLQHYGGTPPRCACCGEATFEFLAIDHINGGGRKEKLLYGSTIQDRIIRNKFPEGYRVLCHNCNQAISAYGSCPHELRRELDELLLKELPLCLNKQ